MTPGTTMPFVAKKRRANSRCAGTQVPHEVQIAAALVESPRLQVRPVSELHVEVVVVVALPRRQISRIGRPHALQRHWRRTAARRGAVEVLHQVVVPLRRPVGHLHPRCAPETSPPGGVRAQEACEAAREGRPRARPREREGPRAIPAGRDRHRDLRDGAHSAAFDVDRVPTGREPPPARARRTMRSRPCGRARSQASTARPARPAAGARGCRTPAAWPPARSR